MNDSVVACYAGHSYAQKPTAFNWDGKKYAIETITAEWRSPDGKHFQVTTEDGHIVELFYDQAIDTWKISPPRNNFP